ncbi:MAG: putative N6-adenine-specific DNA methylase [Urechidicola sp.]|jgi:putative N6-adenine-specific DNA methylase|tara:strand:- start:2102 stop:3238 length:1137 start_codon:yes stop_codon:yes gene_type:complete
MSKYDKHKYIAKTLKGLEQVVKQELIELGIPKCRVTNRAIEFHATKEQMYACNYNFRTAISILKPMFAFTAKDENELYDKVKELEWEKIFGLDKTFAISHSVNSTVFTHSQYISLKTKDAIVDRFRDKFNDRPNVDAKDPDIKLNLYIRGEKCQILLDTSGDALFKRGYRLETNSAPLNEVMAAGLLALSGWDKNSALIDPMCGSGTIAIEAGMMLCNIPAGHYRTTFGFFNWEDFDQDLWKKVRNESNAKIDLEKGIKIQASDLAMRSVRMAQSNLRNTPELNRIIRFKVEDALEIQASGSSGTIIINPPYGERIYKDEVAILYQRFGEHIKKEFEGYKLGVLSSNTEALNLIPLEKIEEFDMMNGSIDCKYQLFKA